MLKTIVEVIVAVFAIIGGLYAAYILMIKKLKSRRDTKDNSFSGYWSNEGNVINNLPSHYLDLHLYCSKRKIIGTFNIRTREDTNGWHKADISGNRRYSSALCKVTFSKDGNDIIEDKVKLEIINGKELKWSILVVHSGNFPSGIKLNRSLPVLG